MAPPAADPTPDVPPTPRAEAPAGSGLCPRCGGKLTNPEGLGWCPGCGYCRSVAEEKAVVAVVKPPPPRQPSWLGASEFGEAMRRMPRWAWPLLGGAAVVAGISVAADYLLPDEGLARALWSAIQIVLGVAGILAAQLWVVMLIGEGEDGIGPRDVITGGRVWRAALRRLPATRKPVWLGAWSLTAVVAAAAIIGGFDYWMEAVRGTKVRRLAWALDAGERPPPPDTGRAIAPSLPPSLAAVAGPRSVAQCAVIGYESDGTKVTGLLLATADGNDLKFAGTLKEGISPEQAKDLLERLSRLARDQPLIPGLKLGGAHWVKPGLFCDVLHSGADKEGHLEKPALKELRD